MFVERQCHSSVGGGWWVVVVVVVVIVAIIKAVSLAITTYHTQTTLCVGYQGQVLNKFLLPLLFLIFSLMTTHDPKGQNNMQAALLQSMLYWHWLDGLPWIRKCLPNLRTNLDRGHREMYASDKQNHQRTIRTKRYRWRTHFLQGNGLDSFTPAGKPRVVSIQQSLERKIGNGRCKRLCLSRRNNQVSCSWVGSLFYCR